MMKAVLYDNREIQEAQRDLIGLRYVPNGDEIIHMSLAQILFWHGWGGSWEYLPSVENPYVPELV